MFKLSFINVLCTSAAKYKDRIGLKPVASPRHLTTMLITFWWSTFYFTFGIFLDIFAFFSNFKFKHTERFQYMLDGDILKSTSWIGSWKTPKHYNLSNSSNSQLLFSELFFIFGILFCQLYWMGLVKIKHEIELIIIIEVISKCQNHSIKMIFFHTLIIHTVI